MKKRLIVRTVLVMALVMGIAGLSWAQQGKGGMMKDGSCPMAKDGYHMGMGGGGMYQQLNLSGQQQEQVKAVMDSYQAEMKALDEKIDTARKSVHEAVHADIYNETAIRDAHKTLSAEMEDMAVLRGKIFSEIRPLLTPEQVTQLKEMRGRKHGKMGNRPKCPAMTQE